jgi:hypothetical protein
VFTEQARPIAALKPKSNINFRGHLEEMFGWLQCAFECQFEPPTWALKIRSIVGADVRRLKYYTGLRIDREPKSGPPHAAPTF